MSLRFSILGPVQVRRDDRKIPLGSPKQRVLLTVLLLEANRTVSLERLVDAVWDEDPPRSAVANLRTYANRLRDVLGAPERLVARPPGYLLSVGPGEFDLTDFAEAVRRGREALFGGDPGTALRHLSAALSLWRGAPAEDVPRSAALGPRLDALGEQRALALEALAEARIALGEHAEVIAELRETLGGHATRERLWGHLMLALYRTGDAAAALAAYAQARAVLREELGVEPGPELASLHQAILRRDPALGEPVRLAEPSPAEPDAPGAARAARLPPAQLLSTPSLSAPSLSAPALSALPVPPARFVGRDRELKDLVAEITTPAPRRTTIAVHGPAGTGKSALAIHAAHLAADAFPDGALYVDLRSCAGLGASATLTRLLAALGVPAYEDVPADESEAVQRFVAATTGRRLLVLLDNVTEERQVRPLLDASCGCRILVTSRRMLAALDHVEHVPLGPLEHSAAAELLIRLRGRKGSQVPAEHAGRVAELCDHLPLALCIAGKRLAVRQEWSPGAFAAMLADERHRLDLLTYGDLSVRGALRPDYESLLRKQVASDEKAVALFHRLGMERITDLDPVRAAWLLGCDPHAASAALGRLADLRLIEPAAEGLYRMNSLIRLYALEMARSAMEG
ncbi:BTAD domain-containing putative transcriptional regulator [Microbispora sp. NPDC046933]|uniref:AfsR/SARP family transcriptional regulator n=1 Tax=Microbispora sp. NPDC046933 TaxID=3155618 RepID=UPI00340CCA99